MSKFPKDCSARQIGAKARQLVHSSFDVSHWEYHELTGTDHGVDCTLELIENDEYINRKIEGQIKGTQKPMILKNKKEYSFSLEIKTINYALNSVSAFVLFLVDVSNEKVYYLPLQDYFISNPQLLNKLNKNATTISVHIPCDNIVSKNDFELQEIAKSIYSGITSHKLEKLSPKKEVLQ